MSGTVPLHSYSYREYLALEEAANVRHEFLNGEIYAMAGGTPESAALTASVGAALVAELETDPESRTTATNPTVVVEVLSDSTASYDRGEKLAHYKRIESLGAVLLFSQSTRRVEVHHRVVHGWRTDVLTDDQTVAIACLDASLAIAALYDDARL